MSNSGIGDGLWRSAKVRSTIMVATLFFFATNRSIAIASDVPNGPTVSVLEQTGASAREKGLPNEIAKALASAKAERTAEAERVTQAERTTDAELRAADLLEQNNFAEARKLIVAEIAALKSSTENSIAKKALSFQLYYMLGFIEQQAGNGAATVKALEEALKSEAIGDEKNLRARIRVYRRIGDAYYRIGDFKHSLGCYEEGLSETKSLPDTDMLRPALLQSVLGTLVRSHDFAQAEPYANQLVRVTDKFEHSENLTEIGAWMWSRLQLMDVYRQLGKESERLTMRGSIGPTIDRILTKRSELEASHTLPEYEEIKHDFTSQYMKENPPSCLADYLWLAINWRPFSSPLVRWQPPSEIKPKAAIVCVHGLGLENRAFAVFGHEMSKRGYAVYALDIRGFGAWMAVHGHEDADFQTAISDIYSVINFIKMTHGNLPVFVLGESMGGAIALQAASAPHNNLISGIISSVPSAERFNQHKMTLSVAIHFLHDKDRPFDIGHQVAAQATSNEQTRKRWEEDPMGKMKLSPEELIKFDSFMKSTAEQCKSIKTMPVLVIQGLKDKLVKPAGTYSIFDNIANDDKVLLIIGNAEHLIFESSTQNKLVLDGISSWLERVSATTTLPPLVPSTQPPPSSARPAPTSTLSSPAQNLSSPASPAL